MAVKKIAVFASGSGSNAENLYHYFSKNDRIKIALIVTNNPKAYVINRAKRLHIPYLIINKEALGTNNFFEKLNSYGITHIVLAGFLLKIPEALIKVFPNKIINIHPSLLPKYGGKGMYGSHVHEAVIKNKEKESGITIHLVNEKYDDGKILFQANCLIDEKETPESLAQKIHELEYKYFPKVVEEYLYEK
ncbi:MAG: phosphoribosylglycinamide formyltransferase [Vicingaceae bacterium]